MSSFSLSPKIVVIFVVAAAVIWIASGLLKDDSKPLNQLASTSTTITVGVKNMEAVDYQQHIILRGKSVPARSVTLRAQQPGLVKNIDIEEGEFVQAQDVLIRLAIEDRPARNSQAKALVNQRQAEFKAAKKLARKGFKSQLKLREAEAKLEEAKANLIQSQINLKKTTITAPFAGVFRDQQIEVGDYLKEGDRIGNIVELDPLTIQANITQNDIDLVRSGQKALVRFDDEIDIEGIISFIDYVAKDITRTFIIEATIANPDNVIRAGLLAEMRIVLDPIQAHHLSAGLLTLNEDGVLGIKTVNDQGQVVFHTVVILGQDSDGIWISGLPDKAQIIILGQDYVSKGEKVTTRPIDDNFDPQ